jgi:glycosyltransferase involved in cell wall biosynthesis
VYKDTADARRPAVVHAHYMTTGYLAMTGERPLVVSAYGFDVSVMARRRLWRGAFDALSHRVAAVLVEGPRMRETVAGMGFDPTRVRIVRIAAGHDRLAFSPPEAISGRGPRLLTAGRFVEKKGIGLAIKAFERLGTEWPDATLEIVGSGPLDADLRATAASSSEAARITFAGSLPRQAYLDRVRAADLLLAPSVTARNGDSEGGAPTTILDAQAVGTIVVGSTHADIPFLIEDGRTGFLAPEGDVDGLADAIGRALDSIQQWTEIAVAARTIVDTRHDDATLAAALCAVYSEVTA